MMSSFFFFNDTATTEIYTLSLHDALPISRRQAQRFTEIGERALSKILKAQQRFVRNLTHLTDCCQAGGRQHVRSEEHTSELQSHLNLVCRLLLEKKKTNIQDTERRVRRRA